MLCTWCFNHECYWGFLCLFIYHIRFPKSLFFQLSFHVIEICMVIMVQTLQLIPLLKKTLLSQESIWISVKIIHENLPIPYFFRELFNNVDVTKYPVTRILKTHIIYIYIYIYNIYIHTHIYTHIFIHTHIYTHI